MMLPRYRRLCPRSFIWPAIACVSACAVGPDYHKPAVQIPESFKEGAEWQRAQQQPAKLLSGTWWREYQDERLAQLIERSLKANQSIAAAEAAYRLALATVQANVASLFPVVSAALSGSRTGAGAGAASGATAAGVYNTFAANVSASWEPDLWGGIRRGIES